MANYKETTLAGTAYIRANSVNVSNGETSKAISFQEEKVINLDDGEVIRKQVGQVWSSFTAENAQTAFPLLNPETGQPLVDNATMTYEGVYMALYSLYLHLATERDAYVAQQAADAAQAEADAQAAAEAEAEEPVV